jgi:diacylglycerol kinase family enzyme
LIGIIANPNAKGVLKDRGLSRRLADIVGLDGIVYETRTPDDLKGAMREFRRRGVKIIATCGGDGTNLTTLSEMVKVWQAKQVRKSNGVAAAQGEPPNDPPLVAMEIPAEVSAPIGIWQARTTRSAAGLPRPPHADNEYLAPPPEPLPKVAILRGGTVNTVAHNVGLKGRPDEILARVVEHYRAGQEIPHSDLDLLEVNGMYGFLFGACMPGRFFEAYYGGPTTGATWASVLAMRTVASAVARGSFAKWMFSPIPAEVTIDGRVLDSRAFTLLVAATVQNVGIGVRVPYRAGTVPGRFHLVASSLPMMNLIGQFARVFGGRPLRGEPHTDTLAKKAEIKFEEMQTYTLDGDLFRAERILLAAGPRVSILRA